MDEILMYCYEKLNEVAIPQLTEEEYVKSMDIVECFLARYQCYLDNINLDSNNKRFVLKFRANDDEGTIIIDSKKIDLEIQKKVQYSSKVMFERLLVAGDTFSGNYCDFVYNPSSVEIYMDNRRTMCLGKECNTDFNNNGIIDNGETISYVSDDNMSKLREAYYSHTILVKDTCEDFLVFDDLNIVKLSIQSEPEEKGGKRKIN